MKKTKGKLLIVDDNPEALIALEMYLDKHFMEVQTERNPNLIPRLISSNNFDVIILDMNFSAGISSGNEGLFWLKEILKIDPLAAVIFITAYGDIELAVRGIKKGAHDFITKPWENEKLLATVLSAFKYRRSKLEIVKLKSKQQHLSDHIARNYHLFTGQSESMTEVMETVKKVAETDANVLIFGENGTGKELIARELHKLSPREIFISVDIASLPQSLMESELFGYNKGAFTDAKKDKPGRFELAEGGTLFLDEVGNIPLHIQSKILTVLQNREIFRLGGEQPVPVNFRLISATNSSLLEMVNTGNFREDLLYRLNTIQIELPPLRKRIEDIEGLTNFFIRQFGKKYKKEYLSLHSTAINKLQKYNWPGNIRELEHLTEKAVILSEKKALRSEDFLFSEGHISKESMKKVFSLAENEKIIIRNAMRECNGNLSESADRLGITRATLYRKIKKYDL